MPEIDPYAVLGVPRTATREEIARAYRALARRNHPDVGTAPSRAMAHINEAWSILGSPTRRARWDANHRVVPPPHWAAAPPEPVRGSSATRPDPRAVAPPPSRFDSPRAATAVVLVVVGLLGAVVAGLSRFEGGASAPAPDLVTDEIAVSIPPGWTWAGGSETEPAGHGVIAHLLSFGAAGDELSLPIEGGFPLEVADLPAGQASVLITAWETGTPPVPDPVVGRPHGLDADRFIGGAAAAFRLRRFADGATAWWQLSPPGFPDRWIEVSATINGLPREQDERLAEIDAILESLEFRGG